jgi:tetratricopeptide (TPR) repeat protein
MGFGAVTPDSSLIVEEAAEDAAGDPEPAVEIEAASDEIDVDPGLAGFEIETSDDGGDDAEPLPMMDDAEVELPLMGMGDDSAVEAPLPTMGFDDDSSEGAVELPTMDFDDDGEEAVPLPMMDFDDDSSEGAVELPMMDFDSDDASDGGVAEALEHAFEETEAEEAIEIVADPPASLEEAAEGLADFADALPELPVESVAAPVPAVEPVAPVPPPTPVAPEPPAAPRPPAVEEPDGGFIDLGAMILGDTAKKSTRFTVAYEEPSGDEEADFAKMLSQFKDKVSENLDSSDVRAHYDLGTAYKEMGLLDEAISSFQAALRASSDHLPTYELMGQTFLEMEQPEAAVRSLERAVESADTVEDELVGIYYYLGRAYEDLANRESAVEYYDRVFSLDINFMDVTERLRELR